MAAARKAAVTPPVLEDDETTLTPEEQAAFDAQSGEQPEPEATPEAATPATGEQPKQRKPLQEAVSFDRFEQVNERLRAAEAQLAETQQYRERWARLEERQKQAQEVAEQQRQQEEAARRAAERPDPTIDPVGARAYDAEQRAMRAEMGLQQLNQRFEQLNVQSQANAVTQDLQNWLAYQVPQARMRHQDYDTRVDYARAARAAWWSSTFQLPDGRQVQLFSPEQARDITAREEMVLLTRAKEQGIPISEAVVRLSDTWGYPQWVAQQQQAAAAQNGNGNGGVRQVAPQQVLPSANQRLEQIERGQAVQGLGRVQSGETQQSAQWQTMGPDEFKQFVANMNEDLYLQMIQHPQYGKQFERRVGEIDLTDLG